MYSWFEIDGNRFGVLTTSESFAEWIEEVLAPYAVEEDPERDGDPLYALVVNEGGGHRRGVGRNYHLLYRGTWDLVRTFDIATLARAFLLDLETIRMPVRDDAVYVNSAAMTVRGKTVVVPASVVPAFGQLARRAQRTGMEVRLPEAVALSVDSSGSVIPTRSDLLTPADAIDRARALVPGSPLADRFTVDRPLNADAIVVIDYRNETGLHRAPKALTLHSLAARSTNLRTLGGAGLLGLGRLVQGADCYAYIGGSAWDMLRQIWSVVSSDGGGTPHESRRSYDDDRSEDTQPVP